MLSTVTPLASATVRIARAWRLRLLRTIAGIAVIASGSLLASGAGANLAVVSLSEASNGHAVIVAPGARLSVTLHSTYWSIPKLPSSGVLSQVGTTKTVGVLQGCVPGQGCGTVTAHYVAAKAGVVRLRATRTTCGEAMRCTGDKGVWWVVVRVR
jgi:hypothetical protein